MPCPGVGVCSNNGNDAAAFKSTCLAGQIGLSALHDGKLTPQKDEIQLCVTNRHGAMVDGEWLYVKTYDWNNTAKDIMGHMYGFHDYKCIAVPRNAYRSVELWQRHTDYHPVPNTYVDFLTPGADAEDVYTLSLDWCHVAAESACNGSIKHELATGNEITL